MIDFSCPICAHGFSVSDDNGGKVGKCPTCGEKIRIPKCQTDSIEFQPIEAPNSVSNTPQSDAILVAAGVNGTIELTPTTIRINRRGVLAFLTQGLKGSKEILLTEVSAIQFKKAGFLNGYIQVGYRGGLENKGGLFDATTDENTVMFRIGQNDEFE